MIHLSYGRDVLWDSDGQQPSWLVMLPGWWISCTERASSQSVWGMNLLGLLWWGMLMLRGRDLLGLTELTTPACSWATLCWGCWRSCCRGCWWWPGPGEGLGPGVPRLETLLLLLALLFSSSYVSFQTVRLVWPEHKWRSQLRQVMVFAPLDGEDFFSKINSNLPFWNSLTVWVLAQEILLFFFSLPSLFTLLGLISWRWKVLNELKD